MNELADRHDVNRPFPLIVLRTKNESDGVISLELGSVDGVPLPEWEAGAHIDILLSNGLVRQYSLCGDCTDRQSLKIAVLRDSFSRGGSSFIHAEVRVGDRILAAGPRNNFPLVVAYRYLFIAGGIGITPILPMLGQASKAQTPWTLVYGGKSRRSMAFLETIARNDRGHVHLVPQDEFGHIDVERYLGGLLTPTAVYCCGPDPLIDAVEQACRKRSSVTLHRERFTAKHRSDAAIENCFEVKLALSGRLITVSPEQSLLSALESAGYNITNSCRAGICGTCLLKVIGGTPDHRDDLLSDAQREAGSMILPCVSRSKTRQLILEL
jgi:ferredoxin-NADP reductase